MNPVIKSREVFESQWFSLLFWDFFQFSWVIFNNFLETSWNDRGTELDSENLTLQQMFFLALEMRVSNDWSFKISRKHNLDLSGGLNLLWSNNW